MTMILGINLSHKLILAGDTRVTRRIEGRPDPIYIDNIAKVLPLWSKQNIGQAFYNKDSIALAVAGDVYFCSFLYKAIQEALQKKELSSDIREFAKQILDFIKLESDKWLMENEFSHCALIFGGISPRRNKKISLKKLGELKTEFEKEKENERETRDKSLKEALEKDPLMIAINKRIKESGRASGVLEMLKEGEKPVISSWLQEALDKNSDDIEMPDSLLVGVSVDHRKCLLQIETAEWGEMLGYGAELTKDKLETGLIAQFELTHIKEESKGPDLIEAAITRQVILDYASKKGLPVIGGEVLVFFLNKKGEITARAPGFGADPKTGRSTIKIKDYQVPLATFYELAKSKDGKNKLEMSLGILRGSNKKYNESSVGNPLRNPPKLS